MPFVYTVRPRYGEVDMQKVVFNAHWLAYFDDAVTRYFAYLGFDPKEVFEEHATFDMMVVKATLEWKGSAGYDDEIAIVVRPARLGNASFDMAFSASVGERPVCEGLITYVSIVPGENRSAPIAPVLRERLEKDMAG